MQSFTKELFSSNLRKSISSTILFSEILAKLKLGFEPAKIKFFVFLIERNILFKKFLKKM